MVVAGIDTGVRYTHEVLQPRYRGNLGGGVFDHDYNWLDDVDGSAAAPSDDHGSHTVGTIRLTSNDPCAETTDIDLALSCGSSSVIFIDGFEDGTTGRWSNSMP